MKITISNLGPVHDKAEIDLKPLTVLIGPNNAGKTWLAYTLGGILGTDGFSKYMSAYIREEVDEKYSVLENAVDQLLEEGNAIVDLIQFIEDNGETYFNNVARHAKTWMRQFIGSEKASFENFSFSLSLTDTKRVLVKRALDISLEHNLAVGRGKHKPLFSALKEKGKREIYFYTSTEENTAGEKNATLKLPRRVIREFVLNRVFSSTHQALYSYIQFFPIERTFFVTFSPARVERRLITANEASQEVSRSEQKAKPLPGYIGRFLETLIFISDASPENRRQDAIEQSAVADYMEFTLILQREILGGNVDFSTSDPNEPQREILFTTTEITLDMPAVSSMVKELTPLVLYLRYAADPGELLIIDEPEMNLHPEAQVKIIEFLAMLVNAGLRVLITTHSPYIVDHLASLMKADKSADKEAEASQFFLHDSRAFIAQKEVAVYKVEHGKVENILDEDGIINWGTFGEVSNRIIEIYGNL
ncbi:MAG: ATP-binding protein [Chloroflexota bacterium]|nr:ATP-binding protein [Chloroflexota bacterium]